MPRSRQLAGSTRRYRRSDVAQLLIDGVLADGVELGLLPGQAGQIELVAELAAQHLLRQHVGIVENRMDDRNLALIVRFGEAVIVDRADVEIAAVAGAGEVKLRDAFGGNAGLKRIERAG